MNDERIILVQKVKVTLLKGESLDQFSGKIMTAGENYLSEILKLEKNNEPYSKEIYGDKMVLYVSRENGASKYYSLSYVRGADGNFSFSDIKEVEKIIAYPEKEKVKKFSDRWKETVKSFWEGIF